MSNLATKEYESRAYSHVLQINKKSMKTLKVCKKSELNFDEFANKKDVYYTVNSFNSMYSRRRENLFQLNSLFVDIDVKNNAEMNYYEVISEIEKLVKLHKIPNPTKYVSSGRGLHVYFYIENCHAMLLDLYDKLEKYLFREIKTIEKVIKDIEVDVRSTDATRLLRVEHTINSKNNAECYCLMKNEDAIYNIFDLKKQYLKSTVSKKYKKQNKVLYLNTKNLYTLNIARMNDLKMLVSMRNYDVVGYRNTLIMLYSYFYRMNNDITLDELIDVVKDFNNSFKERYKIRELISVCRSVNRTVKYFREDNNNKIYKFTNSYIIDALDITETEQQHLKTIISKEEKYRRNNERRTKRNEHGLTKREQLKKDRVQAVLELKQKNLTQVEIAKRLNISQQAVSKIINELEK